MIAPRLRRDPQRFNSIEASIAWFSDLKVCWVFIGLNHAKGQKNRRASVMAATVRFNHASFGAACAAFPIPENLSGKGFDPFGTVKPLFLQSLRGLDPVGVAGCGFNGLFL